MGTTRKRKIRENTTRGKMCVIAETLTVYRAHCSIIVLDLRVRLSCRK
jgi:hypothetical protein